MVTTCCPRGTLRGYALDNALEWPGPGRRGCTARHDRLQVGGCGVGLVALMRTCRPPLA